MGGYLDLECHTEHQAIDPLSRGPRKAYLECLDVRTPPPRQIRHSARKSPEHPKRFPIDQKPNHC